MAAGWLPMAVTGIVRTEPGTATAGQTPGRPPFPHGKAGAKSTIPTAPLSEVRAPLRYAMASLGMPGTLTVTGMASAVSDRPGMTKEQELWAVALWVEKHHGPDGPRYIAEQVSRLALEGDEGGVLMWRGVAERFDALYCSELPHGTC